MFFITPRVFAPPPPAPEYPSVSIAASTRVVQRKRVRPGAPGKVRPQHDAPACQRSRERQLARTAPAQRGRDVRHARPDRCGVDFAKPVDDVPCRAHQLDRHRRDRP